VDLQNLLLNQKSITLQAKFSYESAQLKLLAESKLRDTHSIAEIDYRRTELNVQQLLASYEIEQERLQKSNTNIVTQLAAKEAIVTQLQKSLDRANNKVAALQVTASMSGVVQAMDLKVGQRLLPGSEIARVARQDKLYAELKVQARQAGDIMLGQRVVIDTRSGTVEGAVSRIDPAVNEGTVLIDVQLTGPLPKAARPALPIDGRIYIAQLSDVLFVGKPGYSQKNSRISVYRLGADNTYAQRTPVETGQASVNHIEIRSGLKEGDRIILSDSSDWQKHARIMVN
jgi:multidrug efflux pump subunit AcrA (membrane-fusion protein)